MKLVSLGIVDVSLHAKPDNEMAILCMEFSDKLYRQ